MMGQSGQGVRNFGLTKGSNKSPAGTLDHGEDNTLRRSACSKNNQWLDDGFLQGFIDVHRCCPFYDGNKVYLELIAMAF